MPPVLTARVPPSAAASSLSSLPGASGRLLRRVHRACRPSLLEPNISLNLEICDLVNEKQGSLPREACVAVVKLVNSRDPRVAELATVLLDYLVKNCGYPVHLQVSRKEFLNELVRRFPERPPPAYSRAQRDVLRLINEWVHTICKTSRNKDDLVYIKDMYRLLRSKGYEFPAVKKEDLAVLNPSDNIKSIEELQEEEKIAQSAKLHELIRRGRPQDLKEANDLMKIMSGFKEDGVMVEAKQKVHDDLKKLGHKVDVLLDLLNTNGGVVDKTDDTIMELISTVKVSHPRLQKIIQEDQEDERDISELLVLNDKMNSILQRIGVPTTGNSSAAAAAAAAPASMNLIDFDDDVPSAPPANGAVPTSNDAIADLLGDLGGLSIGGDQSSSGAINLLGSNDPPKKTNVDILSGFQQQITSPVSSQLDPFGFDFNTKPAVSSPAPTSSSAPASASKVLLTTSDITVTYQITSKDQSPLNLLLTFTTSSGNLTDVQLSLAVTKAFSLEIQPATSTSLSIGGKIEQKVSVRHRNGESFDNVKFKYKIEYTSNGSHKEESNVANVRLGDCIAA